MKSDNIIVQAIGVKKGIYRFAKDVNVSRKTIYNWQEACLKDTKISKKIKKKLENHMNKEMISMYSFLKMNGLTVNLETLIKANEKINE